LSGGRCWRRLTWEADTWAASGGGGGGSSASTSGGQPASVQQVTQSCLNRQFGRQEAVNRWQHPAASYQQVAQLAGGGGGGAASAAGGQPASLQ